MKRVPSPETSPEPEPPMATDLELLRDLPKLRLRIEADESSPPPPESTASSASTTSDDAAVNPDEEEEEEGYRTPTSEESRIQKSGICPPAPVKPRLRLLCKRKRSELEFFETRNRAEVEEFFRQAEEPMKRTRIIFERIVA